MKPLASTLPQKSASAPEYGPYSHNRLETGNCAFSFYEQYVKKSKKQKLRDRSVASDRGSAAHEVLEKITKAYVKDNTYHFTEQELNEWIVESVERYPMAYSEVSDIFKMARMYARNPPPLGNETRTEQMLAVRWDEETKRLVDCVYDHPDAVIRGRIDVLDIDLTTGKETATIYDHKTQPNIETADTLQMGIYAWLVKRSDPYLKEVKTILHFSRYDRYSQPVVWTEEDLAEIETEIFGRIRILEQRKNWKDAEATPHKGCQYCPVIAKCPALASMVTVGEDGFWHVVAQSFKILGSPAKAVQIAGLIHILEHLLKVLKDELKEFVKFTETPVAIPGKVYGYTVSDEKVDYDMVNKAERERVYQVFKDNHVDERRYMVFSSTSMAGIWRLGNQRLMDALAKVLPTKKETRFEGKKG